MALVSKIVYDGVVIADLTQDSVNESNLLLGYTAHNRYGEPITGILEVYDPEGLDPNQYPDHRAYLGFNVSNEVLEFTGTQGTKDEIRFGTV